MKKIIILFAVLFSLTATAQKPKKPRPNTTTGTALQAPTSLSYNSPNTFVAGTMITALNPTVSGGTATLYTVSPALPAGLSISPTSGIISGTPTVATGTATYTVTASNSVGSKIFGVVITVNAPPVSAPASLSYNSPNTFVTGTPIAALSPAVTGGAVVSYTVSPALPAGLTINPTSGIISGTPNTATGTTTYTVTASNSAGIKTFGVVITVNAAVAAPASLSYNSPNTFVSGTAITALNPTVTGGAVTSYTVTPSLPAGLSISQTTGIISGTPTTATATGTYTVTASNSAGNKIFGVVITVNAPPVVTPTPTPTPTMSTVVYTPTTAAFQNPERGFYKHTETHSSSYYPLSQSALTSYRTNSNITLILRVFYLENFVNSPISSTYLSNMQQDFAKIRAAGLKCIVRFAYADHHDPGIPHDATKAMILSHITQLTPILQANSDIISVMQAGFIGSWGEWYYTDHFGMSPTATDYLNRKDVLNAVLAALPNRMVQIRTPKLKQNTYGTTTALSLTQAYSGVNLARVGHHNDCFLASSDDYGTYSNPTVEYPYLEQETKYTPMGGETCAVNAPRSECSTAVTEMAKFHWSYLNMDYHETVIAGFQTNNCFSEIQNRLGYRFELIDGSYPSSAVAGAVVPVTMKIKNSGFATPFNSRTPYIVFRNVSTNAEYRVALNSNPRFWNPASTVTVTDNIVLPADLAAGSYRMYLALPDSDPALSTRPEYSIRFANNNTYEASTGYNYLNHTINIGSVSARIADAKIETLQPKLTATLYPVPANDAMAIEMENIGNAKITIFNSLGQQISANMTAESDNKVMLNTSSFSNGVYFVSIGSGDAVETKRFIVSH